MCRRGGRHGGPGVVWLLRADVEAGTADLVWCGCCVQTWRPAWRTWCGVVAMCRRGGRHGGPGVADVKSHRCVSRLPLLQSAGSGLAQQRRRRLEQTHR